MSVATVKFDRKGFVTAMQQVSRETGMTMADILRDNIRLWGNTLVRWTIPKSAKQGREAIRKDMERIFAPIDNPAVIRRWFEDEGTDEVVRYSKDGKKFRIPKDVMAMINAPLRDWHAKHRTRKGRVKIRYQSGEAWGGKLPVPSVVLRRYIKQVQERLGRLKAGWLGSGNRLGLKAPRFVMRHIGRAEGMQADTLQGATMTGHVAISNAVPYARDKSGMMQRSLRLRLKDLQSGRYVQRLQKVMNKHIAR